MTVTLKKHGDGSEEKKRVVAKAKRAKVRGFKRLMALGEEKVTAINKLLLKDEQLIDVARFIQNDLGAYKDVADQSLVKQLRRYKTEVLLASPQAKDASLESETDKQRSVLLEALEERVDVVAALNELIIIQRSRVMAVVQKEEKVGMPFSWLTKDISELKSLITTLADLEFDLGLRMRAPKDVPLHLIPHQNVGEYNRYREEEERSMAVNNAISRITSLIEGEAEDVSHG